MRSTRLFALLGLFISQSSLAAELDDIFFPPPQNGPIIDNTPPIGAFSANGSGCPNLADAVLSQTDRVKDSLEFSIFKAQSGRDSDWSPLPALQRRVFCSVSIEVRPQARVQYRIKELFAHADASFLPDQGGAYSIAVGGLGGQSMTETKIVQKGFSGRLDIPVAAGSTTGWTPCGSPTSFNVLSNLRIDAGLGSGPDARYSLQLHAIDLVWEWRSCQ